jgi:hypothetical protein
MLAVRALRRLHSAVQHQASESVSVPGVRRCFLMNSCVLCQVIAEIARDWSEAAARAQAVCVPTAAQTP